MIGVSGDNEEFRARQFRHLPGDPPYDECAKIARQRGREVFGAVFAEFPDAKMHFSRLYSNEIWNYYFGARDARRLVKERGDLWVHYLDGALDVLPPNAVLYEGAESGYRHDPKYHDSLESAARIKTDLVWAVAPENRNKYRAQVRVAMPVYVDRYETPEQIAAIGNTLQKRYVVNPVDGSYVAALERDLADKIAASDDYVWIYAEHMPLVRWVRPKEWNQWRKHDGQLVFNDYLPGLNDLLAGVQHPEEWAERRISLIKAKGALKNIVPGELADGALPPPLSVWQDKADLTSSWTSAGRTVCRMACRSTRTCTTWRRGARSANCPSAAPTTVRRRWTFRTSRAGPGGRSVRFPTSTLTSRPWEGSRDLPWGAVFFRKW